MKKSDKQLKLEKDGVVAEGHLNEVLIIETRRQNGTVRIQQDFQFCPTLAEQHTGHLTDLNYLVERYKPDELGHYLAARSEYRREILGHDFSQELTMQDAMNVVVQSRKAFDELPDDVRTSFKNHVEFLKFIDNPANEEKMVKLGLLTRKQAADLKAPLNTDRETEIQTTTTQEEKDKSK